MRALAWLLAAWLALSPAFADGSFVAPTANGTAAVGQLPGTTTNDDAAAGKVGEFVSASATFETATVTFTSASPTVVTWTAHPFTINSSGVATASVVYFTNSGGALPTGVTASTNYYAVPINANTFRIATSVANAFAGTFVNASSTGTGTHTGVANAILSTTAYVDINAVNLTAGDWDCSGMGILVTAGGASPTRVITYVGTTSGTNPSGSSLRGAYTDLNLAFGTALIQQFTLGNQRFSLASTTAIIGGISATFPSGSIAGQSLVRCRRMR